MCYSGFYPQGPVPVPAPTDFSLSNQAAVNEYVRSIGQTVYGGGYGNYDNDQHVPYNCSSLGGFLGFGDCPSFQGCDPIGPCGCGSPGPTYEPCGCGGPGVYPGSGG